MNSITQTNKETAMTATEQTKKIQNGVIKIGSCPVDSGQIMLVDPCYLDDFNSDDYDFQQYNLKESGAPFSYSGVCNVTLQSAAQGGQVGSAVATTTGWGDGRYPVFATIEDGRVTQVTIYFDGGPNYLSECDECAAIECECDDEAFYNNNNQEENEEN
jgi:hypothetical protein